jgi:hypothetical protein
MLMSIVSSGAGARLLVGVSAGFVRGGLNASPERPRWRGGDRGGRTLTLSLLTSAERSASQDLVDLVQRRSGVGVDAGWRAGHRGASDGTD